MPDSLRVLIAEDSLEDAFLIVQGHAWDLIISDYSMPGFGGPAALELYQQKHLDFPFIIVSGVMGESLAVEMLKAGAHNYVMKNQLGRLVPAVRQELRDAHERRV